MGDRVKDKGAVVTGAGRGIGREVALAMAAEALPAPTAMVRPAGRGTPSRCGGPQTAGSTAALAASNRARRPSAMSDWPPPPSVTRQP